MAFETQLYDLLGIEPDANNAQIKKAYRINALKYHPDKNKDPGAQDVFKELAYAYEVLSDPEKRRLYDDYGPDGISGDSPTTNDNPQPDFSFNAAQNIFSHFFGNSMQNAMNQSLDAMFSSMESQMRRGKDIKHPLKCTLEDLYKGRTAKLALMKTVICGSCQGLGVRDPSYIHQCFGCNGQGKVMFQRQNGPFFETHEVACSKCHGSGKFTKPQDKCATCHGQTVVQERSILTVYVPPGSKHGDCIVLDGEGDQYPNVIPGNVVVIVDEQHHSVFKRKGHDLIHVAQVDLKTALCGGVIDIPSLEGGRLLRVSILQGEIITPGKLKMLSGYGMPIPDLSHQGQQTTGAPNMMMNTPHAPRPIGHGSIYVKFSIRFPKAEDFTSETFTQLASLLPSTPSVKHSHPGNATALEESQDDEDTQEVEECFFSDMTYDPSFTANTPMQNTNMGCPTNGRNKRQRRDKRDANGLDDFEDDVYLEIDGDEADSSVQCATQ